MPVDQKQQIEDAIKQFADGNLFENALNLFNALKYNTHLQAPLDDTSWEGFQHMYVSTDRFNEKMALTSDWKYVNILFQLSENAIKQQIDLFSAGRFDSSIMYSFLYICIELNKEHYSKTQLSQITREINKVFAMPVMVLLKTGNCLTLALINRRLHKRDDTKDVLEKVTLIKDIAIESPHRAHIEILFDLSFNELYRKHGFTNFVELHQAWQKTLDIKELNKRFFKELFNWYLWTIRNVRFPNKVDDASDDTTFNQEAVIRLLTRLIFIWFIKEKNLVSDHLFNNRSLRNVLRDFDPHSQEKSDYYRAILQNLFFATLNTPMDKDITDENRDEKRGFIVPGMPGGRANPHYTDQTRYRYKECFVSEDQALKLFETIPFLNGGLFECLDFPPEDSQPELRIDGFSTKRDKQAFVPNALFFKEEFILDLNEEYGTKGKQYKVKGLIPILSGYKFTITENTPLEEEVALDPELLGKVFENLLATYNPETKSTARKQTGSFYTPREIVNYMVDESLIAFLSNSFNKEESFEDAEKEEIEKRLRHLFSPGGEQHDLDENETKQLISAISHCRILDPACGSGAFPMGILHRMVDLLGKLDPENDHWKEIQKERAIQDTKEAYEIGDQQERNHRLEDISKAFDESINNPDYARKLFLIENCIYGVDIQQIAVQIAKLRFFISLIAEQKVDDSKHNRNILSMPNLETKFVAANTLIGLGKKISDAKDNVGSGFIINPEVEMLQKELMHLRHKIFFARKYHDKKELKRLEKETRHTLETALQESGFNEAAASQMVSWNPFDPLRSSPFFDVETMFGFTGGFDVVIGNPPYGIEFTIYEKEYLKKRYDHLIQRIRNSYLYFMGIADDLIRKDGVFSFIIPNEFLFQIYMEKARRYFLINRKIKIAINTGEDVFIAIVPSCVILVTNQKTNNYPIALKDLRGCKLEQINEELKTFNFQITSSSFILNSQNTIFSFNQQNSRLINTIIKKSTPFNNYCDDIANGISTSCDSVYIVSKNFAIEWEFEKEYLNPSIRGSHINKFFCPDTSGELILYITPEFDKNKAPKIFEYLERNKDMLIQKSVEKKMGIREWSLLFRHRNKELFISPKIVIRQTGDRIIAAIDENKNYFCIDSINIVKLKKKYINRIRFFTALLNSSLLNFVYSEISQESGRVLAQVKPLRIKQLPIIEIQFYNFFDSCVRIIEFLQKRNQISNFFNSLIDAMVYELYLSESIKEAGCDVIKHLQELPELREEWTDKKKFGIIDQIYNELSNPSHPVSIAMERMKEVEEVRIIEGRG